MTYNTFVKQYTKSKKIQMVKVKNLQTCLEVSNSAGKYQTGLVIALSILFFLVNFVLIGPSYIFMNPSFTCEGTGLKIIKQEQACKMIERCQIIQTFTLSAKMKLYCERQVDRIVYQTLFSIGSLMGLLCMNTLADTKGRRFSTLLSMAIAMMAILFNVIGGEIESGFLIVVSQILLGFGGYSLFVLSFIILGDFCEDNLRQKGIVMLNAAAGISLVMMGMFYLFQTEWKTFLLFYLWTPMASLLLTFFFMLQESPYILMTQGRKQQCLNMFKRLCRYNNTSDSLKQIKMLLYRKQSIPIRDQRPYIIKILQIVRKWQNLKIICLVGIIYAIGNVMYFGIEFTFQDQGYNYGINSIIIGCFEMLSFAYLHFNMQRLSRTKGISVFFGMTALVGILFVLPIISQTLLLSSILIGVSRVCFTIGYTLIVCLQTQSFGVQIQSTAAGIIQAISLLGIIVAPTIVSLSMSNQLNPMVVLSLLLLLGIIPNKFIKETHPNWTETNNRLFIKEEKRKQSEQELISIHSNQQGY